MAESTNPYAYTLEEFGVYKGEKVYCYSLEKLCDKRVCGLPYCMRILLESAMRNCDNFEVKESDVQNILGWSEKNKCGNVDISFKPSRVVLQDLTGVPALVDLAAMRDAVGALAEGRGDAVREELLRKIDPVVPVDLVIDHSIQVDFARASDALKKNEEIEFDRNFERFAFLKWGAKSFKNMMIFPPGSGIIHQVNLEYLARVILVKNRVAYPDSLVGTDSHTTMIDGLGIIGWGVGGIEAEAVMLGQPISMVLPQVIGFKLTGKLDEKVTATDLVLTITNILRQKGVVGKFVEFFGDGCKYLNVADRATITNMSPEYGATAGFFPFDERCVEYLEQTNRSKDLIELSVNYFKKQKLYRHYSEEKNEIELAYSSVVELDLSTVVVCLSGPKRPHDQTPLTQMKQDFHKCLVSPAGFKGFQIKPENLKASGDFVYKDVKYTLKHGDIVIAAITSCTNTSNPSVMLGAALLAKNAVERGLTVLPYIKTSLSPGSKVVLRYFQQCGLLRYLEQLGFYVVGFGCMTCIGNSGDLACAEMSKVITENDLVVSSVLSGNRNFEGRVHPMTKANYLASPILCVAYALAGRIDIDFDSEPIGKDLHGEEVFLRDIWPNREAINSLIVNNVLSSIFAECYDNIKFGNSRWNSIEVSEGHLYEWRKDSTYIHNPPFFKDMHITPSPIKNIKNAYCLLHLGDSITTDHISPAGKIARNSPAALYLQSRNVTLQNFNSYGSRRGNDEVMVRGTFANIRLVNLLNPEGITGSYTKHIPTNQTMSIFDAATKYQEEGFPLIIIAGSEYGSGSSRDWAAKGPLLLGVKAVIAKSFEKIHRSNLIGMGILPLEFMEGEDAKTLHINCEDKFSVCIENKLDVGATLDVKTESGLSFKVKCKIDTEVEMAYYLNGGILKYVLRKLVK